MKEKPTCKHCNATLKLIVINNDRTTRPNPDLRICDNGTGYFCNDNCKNGATRVHTVNSDSNKPHYVKPVSLRREKTNKKKQYERTRTRNKYVCDCGYESYTSTPTQICPKNGCENTLRLVRG